MSALLKKSLRLLEESESQKGKKRNKKPYNKNKTVKISLKEKKNKDSIIEENLKKLKALEYQINPDIAEKILSKNYKKDFIKLETEKEEKTAFSEKDFEDFEKSYFVS